MLANSRTTLLLLVLLTPLGVFTACGEKESGNSGPPAPPEPEVTVFTKVDPLSYGKMEKGKGYELFGAFENEVDGWYLANNGVSKFAFKTREPQNDLIPTTYVIEGVFTGWKKFKTVTGTEINVPCLEKARVKHL